MTSSSSTPDIAAQVATLSLGSQPNQQRLHDTYDFDGITGGNGRTPYHYSTSPPIPPSLSTTPSAWISLPSRTSHLVPPSLP